MIDEAENIEEPEGYQQSEILTTVPTEILPAGDDMPSEFTPSSSKLEAPLKEPCPKPEELPMPKKTPPPLPSKPDHLKASIKMSNPENIVTQSLESENSKPVIEPENVSEVNDCKMKSASEELNPKMPASKEYIDENLEDLYKSVKKLWESYDGNPEDFDWEVLAMEIEDLSNHSTDYDKDPYHCNIKADIQCYIYKAGKGINLTKEGCVEIAQEIRQYEKKRSGSYIPSNKMPILFEIGGKDTWQVNGCEDDIDDEDEELEDLWE